MRATWMAGDFGVIAKTITKVRRSSSTGWGYAKGSSVLDVATGTGNLAIPLARVRLRCDGRRYCSEPAGAGVRSRGGRGLTVTFDEGDAEKPPYADGGFDAVVTMFGAMLLPGLRWWSELARV